MDAPLTPAEATVADRLEEILRGADFADVYKRDGRWFVLPVPIGDEEEAVLLMGLVEFGEGPVAIRMWAPVRRRMEPSETLREFVLDVNCNPAFIFGNLRLEESAQEGLVDLVFHHSIIGDRIVRQDIEALLGVSFSSMGELNRALDVHLAESPKT